MAAEVGRVLDRYALIAVAFAGARRSAKTSAALAQAGGALLRNIAVNGQLLSEMTGSPRTLLPLPVSGLSQDRRKRTLLAEAD